MTLRQAGGLIGTLILYGVPAAPATAAVLVYRVILFWVPLVMDAPAFASLRRGLDDTRHPDLCLPLRPLTARRPPGPAPRPADSPR